MSGMRLRLDVACEVDDLGGLVSAEDAWSLAVLRIFHRMANGTLECVAEDTPDAPVRFVVVDEDDVEVGTVRLEKASAAERACTRGFA